MAKPCSASFWNASPRAPRNSIDVLDRVVRVAPGEPLAQGGHRLAHGRVEIVGVFQAESPQENRFVGRVRLRDLLPSSHRQRSRESVASNRATNFVIGTGWHVTPALVAPPGPLERCLVGRKCSQWQFTGFGKPPTGKAALPARLRISIVRRRDRALWASRVGAALSR